jgi:hypothetical protein
LFTERFGEWWPLGQDCEIEPWEGGRVFERTDSGAEVEWGTVREWDSPRRIELTRESGEETVEVEFATEADGTRVTVTHSGWENAAQQPAMLAGCFAEFACAQMMVMV